MKVLYDYIPTNSSDTRLTITASTSDSGFPSTNLKEIQPVKCWKSTVITNSWVKYDAGVGLKFNITSLFMNRFNFASFRVQGSDNDFATTPFDVVVSGLTKDEIYDENYMHYWLDLVAFDYRYLRIYIPTQTPLFDTGYFKIGNLLIGNCVEIWNPKPGYQVGYIEKLNQIEFDSGYFDETKLGRTKRLFSGTFDKIDNTEYNKLRYTRNPIVLYHDWESNPSKCYLVKPTGEFQKSFDYAQITSHDYAFLELV